MGNISPYHIATAMITDGGSFVSALGRALVHADDRNTQRIREAFPDYWEKYEAMAQKGADKAHTEDGDELQEDKLLLSSALASAIWFIRDQQAKGFIYGAQSFIDNLETVHRKNGAVKGGR